MTSATEPSLTFSGKALGLPPLALSDSAKSGPLVFMSDAAAWFRRQSSVPPPVRKLISKMPVRAPGGDVDAKMPIAIPEASIDYKLIVKAPEVESGK